MACPPTGNEAGLVGYWDFEEGTGSVVNDLSGNGNDGTINGASWSTDVPNQTCVGCTATDSVYVDLFQAEIAQEDTMICFGDSVTLNAGGLGTVDNTSPRCDLPSNLQNGLVGYWPFCGNANDESGNGNDGTVNGATLTSDRFGNVNSAYDFDGVTDHIVIQFIKQLPIRTYYIFCLVNPDSLETILYSLGGGRVIVGRDASGYHDQGAVMVYHYPNGGVDNEFLYYRGQDGFPSNYTPSLNEWTHLVVTIDSADSIRYYIDGSLFAEEYGALSSNAILDFVLGLEMDGFIGMAV